MKNYHTAYKKQFGLIRYANYLSKCLANFSFPFIFVREFWKFTNFVAMQGNDITSENHLLTVTFLLRGSVQRNKNHSKKFVLMHSNLNQPELLSPEVTCLKTNRITLKTHFEKKLIFLSFSYFNTCMPPLSHLLACIFCKYSINSI